MTAKILCCVAVLLIPSLAFAQLTLVGVGTASLGGSTPVPTLINYNAGPSTESSSVGTKANNTCATNAYCTQLVDSSLSGNAIVVFVTYGSTATHVPTITDDKGGGSSTYTACASEAHDSTSTPQRWADVFYSLNVAAGIRNITTTFSTGVTNVTVHVSQWNNVNAFDTCAAGSADSTTTFSSGSITPSVSGDLLLEWSCTTTTATDVGAFTAGSQSNITWALHAADRREGCAAQAGQYNSTSAINPQMTIGTSNGHVSVGLALKAATQGTAASGMYISHLYHYNSASGISGNQSLQFPTTGNLFVAMVNGGGTTPLTVTGITDGTNTWSQCGPTNFSAGGGHPVTQSFFTANATPGVLALTVATTGTGDIGPVFFYDITGAASSQTCARTFGSAAVTVPAGDVDILVQAAPGSSSGLMIQTNGVESNTVISFTNPSGNLFDSNTFGSESLSGPTPVDENNGGGHKYTSDNTSYTWTMHPTAAGTTWDYYAAEAVSFQAPGATILPSYFQSSASSTVTGSNTVTVPTIVTNTGDLLWGVCYWNDTSQTATVSDLVNGTWTAIDSPVNGAGSLASFRLQAFYKANITGGSTAPKCVTSGSTSSDAFSVHEVRGASTLDQHPAAKTGSSATATSNTTSTTSVANEYIVGGCVVGNSVTSATSPWALRQDANFASNGSIDRIVTSTGTYQASMVQGASTDFLCLVDTFQP